MSAAPALRAATSVGLLGCVAMMMGLALVRPPDAGAVTAQQAVGYLNAERAAVGLPAGLDRAARS